MESVAPAPDTLPGHAASVLASRHKAESDRANRWSLVGLGIGPISSEYFPYMGYTNLYMLFNFRAKFLSHRPHPLANRSLFPAPPLRCYQPRIFSNAHKVTALVSGLRNSSSIGGSVIVLLVSCDVFSSRCQSFCIE